MSVWETGLPRTCQVKRLILTDKTGHTTEPEEIDVVAGRLHVELPPHSAVILADGEIRITPSDLMSFRSWYIFLAPVWRNWQTPGT